MVIWESLGKFGGWVNPSNILHSMHKKISRLAWIPDGAPVCATCDGFGYSPETNAIVAERGIAHGDEITLCPDCGGKGWKEDGMR